MWLPNEKLMHVVAGDDFSYFNGNFAFHAREVVGPTNMVLWNKGRPTKFKISF
jgi:hypothetical protein